MSGILEEMLNRSPILSVLNHAFVSKNLANSAHCDKDSAMSIANFQHQLANKATDRPRPGCLVFPTYGIAIILRHGTTVSWPGWVPHCTSVGGTKEKPCIVPVLSLFASRSAALDKTTDAGRAFYNVAGGKRRRTR